MNNNWRKKNGIIKSISISKLKTIKEINNKFQFGTFVLFMIKIDF